MKKILLVCFALFTLSLVQAQSTKREQIAQLFSGVMVMSDNALDAQLPIKSINALAKEKAAKTAEVSKANLPDLLKEAGTYSAVYITVGNHTIVKITNLEDCQVSGAWGTCMPMGKGYIQKGDLQSKEGYINFIIGVPDSQKRMIYMFK